MYSDFENKEIDDNVHVLHCDADNASYSLQRPVGCKFANTRLKFTEFQSRFQKSALWQACWNLDPGAGGTFSVSTQLYWNGHDFSTIAGSVIMKCMTNMHTSQKKWCAPVFKNQYA